MTTQAYIQSVIDKVLDFETNYLAGFKWPAELIPANMVDQSKVATDDGMLFWNAGKASISDEAFEEYEHKIGHALPESYKHFLGYRYFMELNFGHMANFFRHTPEWIEENFTGIMADPSSREALGNGFIPFALDGDGSSGWFCFDTNQPAVNHDYKIVTYDRSFEDQVYPSIKGQFVFIDLIKEMEQTLNNWKQRKMESF